MPTAKRPADSTPDVQRLRDELYRALTPAEKLRKVTELTHAAAQLSLAGLARRHPGAGHAELLLRLAALRLGAEAVSRAYGWRARPDAA